MSSTGQGIIGHCNPGDLIRYDNGDDATVITLYQNGHPDLVELGSSKGWSRDHQIPSYFKPKMTDRYWHFSGYAHYNILRKGYNSSAIQNNQMNPYSITTTGTSGSSIVYMQYQDNIAAQAATKPKPKATVFELKHLESLVIEQEVKEEIVAVLKQHKHSDKLFKEWGLGETIEYGKGMTFLFYGPPGTGKTHSVGCIAKTCGKEVLTIGAAEIQSSEPGGANRNIQEAFKTATKEKKILFLDECDSLISSREGLGMILGSEVNTLLTEIEKYEGILVLATNRVENLDAALERRISLIVEFKEPNHTLRQEIWTKILPKKLPLAKGITAEKLADHKLTGGQIKNVLLQAARLALSEESKEVTMAHFEAAIARLLASKSLLGSKSNWNQTISVGMGTDVRKVEATDFTKVRGN